MYAYLYVYAYVCVCVCHVYVDICMHHTELLRRMDYGSVSYIHHYENSCSTLFSDHWPLVSEYRWRSMDVEDDGDNDDGDDGDNALYGDE